MIGLRNVLLLSLMTVMAIGCLRIKPSETQAPTPAAEMDRSALSTEAGSTVPAGEVFDVKFETSKGNFTVEVHPEWAPRGAAQFKKLVESGFYNETRFFRVVPGFMVQWGIHGDPGVQSRWRDSTIPDDPVKQTNAPGMMTFATSGPDSRTTQIFINYANNSFLDSQGFSPFAKVTSGMEVVEAINSAHGEKPDQGMIQSQGNAYLKKNYPDLDYIIKASIVEKPAAAETPSAQPPVETPKTDAASSTESKPEATPAAETKESVPASETPKETIEEIQ